METRSVSWVQEIRGTRKNEGLVVFQWGEVYFALMKFQVALTLALAVVSATQFRAFDQSRLSAGLFFEQFDYELLESSGWVPSHAKKDDVTSYRGKWAIEEPHQYPSYEGDRGLVMKTPAAHHAISYKLEKPFLNVNSDLVLQYEVKEQNLLSCGGAYIKLLNFGFDQELFGASTGYQVMFGPDVCGLENKIHFILNRKSPVTGKYEEKHLRTAPMSKVDQFTNLYTLILRANADFEIRLNGEVAKAGNLLDKPQLLEPRLNPPLEIDDPTDFKPFDWVETEFIDDPNGPEKPADYDEKYGSHTIPDPNAVKPDDWDELEPPYIPDPSAHKPDEWDDDEDGEWAPPDILNPKCVNHGCGPWEPPMIRNQNYKGPWFPKKIPNPAYKGEWAPRKIANPEYYEDKTPANLEPIGGLGFELWTMDTDVLFDNIYVGHLVADAELLGNRTFNAKSLLEWDNYEEYRPKAAVEPEAPPATFDDLIEGPSFFQLVKVFAWSQALEAYDFYYDFQLDPVHTILNYPLKFVVYCCAFLTVFTFGFAILNVLVFIAGGGLKRKETRPRPQEPKIVELEEVEAEVEAEKATGVDTPSARKRK